MSKKYEAIPVTQVGTCEFAHPNHFPELLHIEDKALDAMVDFTVVKAETISADASIDEALAEMKAHGKRILLVTDAEGCLIGLVASEDVQGNKPYQIMEEKRIKRSEIKVKSVMIKKEDITAVNFDDIRAMRLGNIIATMNEHQAHFILVQQMDPATSKPIIRGIFSAPKIRHALGQAVTQNMTEAHSVIELQKYLDH